MILGVGGGADYENEKEYSGDYRNKTEKKLVEVFVEHVH